MQKEINSEIEKTLLELIQLEKEISSITTTGIIGTKELKILSERKQIILNNITKGDIIKAIIELNNKDIITIDTDRRQ